MPEPEPRFTTFDPNLWRSLVLESLRQQTPAWPRTPPKPLTWREKLRRFGWRLLDRWPLQWKERDNDS